MVRNIILKIFVTEFYSINKIVNISGYMHAKHMNLYSFKSPEPTLPEQKKIIQIELLDAEILTIKVKC